MSCVNVCGTAIVIACALRTLEALADVTGLGEELEETLLLQLP